MRTLTITFFGLLLISGACDRAPEPADAPTSITEHESQPTAAAASERMAGNSQSATLEPAQPPSVAATGKLTKRLIAFTQSWAKREAAFVQTYKATFTDELSRIRWFKRLSNQVYQARSFALAFSDGSQLVAGVPMLKALEELESHGLDPARYKRDDVKALVASVDQASQAYDALLSGTDNPKLAALWSVLDALRGRTSMHSAELDDMLADKALSDADLSFMSQIEKRTERVFAAKQKLNTALIRLDLALTQAYFRYAYEMRYRRHVHPFHADASYGRGLERSAEALLKRYNRTTFDANFGQALKDLEPAIPEYAGLRKELQRYRQLAAAGEQVKLASISSRLRPGSKGKFVVALKQRLAQEGYFSGDMAPIYDEALAQAVTLYQTTHQLKVDEGKMSYSTRKSMDRSFKQRADEIALGLQRHRESDLHQDPKFRFGIGDMQARINIPAFEATFYRDGKPARKHRVVVGSNAVETHEKTGFKGHFNRTRLFSKRLKTVVLNPVWRVPPRIKEQELDKELVDEPDFYAKNNYEVKILADGSEQVTQLPGPKNALGLVKFLFPNQYSIYMHDTPSKRLFSRTIRAFSHGCMRVKDALDLARFVLTEVEDMTDRKFDKVLAARKTYGVRLTKDVPISIDYNTVGIHPETGKAMFYADIYKFDRDLKAGKTPYKRYPHRGMEQAVVVSTRVDP